MFPNRNLGAGDSWGRAVETAITALETSVRLLEQRVQSSLNNITAYTRQLGVRADEIERRAEITTTTFSDSNFGIDGNTTNVISNDLLLPNKNNISVFFNISGVVTLKGSGNSLSTAKVFIHNKSETCSITPSGRVANEYNIAGTLSDTIMNRSGATIPVGYSITTTAGTTTTAGNNRSTMNVILAGSNT